MSEHEEDNPPFVVAKQYPPKDHILRDLRLSLLFRQSDAATIRAPVVAQVCSDSGAVHAGVLATLTDVLGGFLSMASFFPDWMATAHLSLHTCRPVVGDTFSATGRIIRCGRTTVTVSADVFADDPGVAAGSAVITYARLEGHRVRSGARRIREQRFDFAWPDGGSGFRRHVVDQAGIRVSPESSGASLAMSDYVRNSFGSLQGGMIALLADIAGQSAARALSGARMATADLVVHYLSPGRTGPFTTETRLMRADGASVLTRVAVKDGGDQDRLVAVAVNTALRVAGGAA